MKGCGCEFEKKGGKFMRSYKLFSLNKGIKNAEWELAVETSDFDFIAKVMKLNAERERNFDWKLVTCDYEDFK